MPPPLDSKRVRRPRRVTIVASGVFTLGAINLWRVIALPGDVALPSAFDPRLRWLMAAIWTLLFMAIAWSLWTGRSRGRIAVPWALLLYALYRLLLLAVYVLSPIARLRWPGVVAAHGVGVAFALWAVHSSRGRAFFARPPLTLSRPSPQTAPNEKSHV